MSRRLPRLVWVAGLALALAVSGHAGGFKPEEYGPLMVRLMEVQERIRACSQPATAAALPLEVKAFWNEVLDYTRTHAGADLHPLGWGIPFGTAHEWLLNFGGLDFVQAETATREGLKVLRAARPADPAAAALVSVRVGMAQANHWLPRQTFSSARLADQLQDWVESLENPRVSAERFAQAVFFDGNCLLYQFNLSGPAREEFVRERTRRFWRNMTDERLSLRLRTLALSHWAQSLYRLGQQEDAERALWHWLQQHEPDIAEQEFYRTLMTVTLLGKGDWELAGKTLDKAAGCRPERWRQSSEKSAYENLNRLYYDNLRFPGYEIRRVGYLQQQDWLKDWLARLGVSGAARSVRR